MAGNSPQKPVQHVKGKPPQRFSQAPKNPVGPELGTLPVEQRAAAQRGRSGVREERARIGVDYNTATSMWGEMKSITQKMIEAKGTPDYDTIAASRDSMLKDMHSKVSPRVAEFGKAWGVASINGASGNRQMAGYAQKMDEMAMGFISRGASFAEQQRLAKNPEPSAGERRKAQRANLHQQQAAQKRGAETLARADRIKQRKNDGS